MKQEILNLFAEALQGNLGNRMTPELANGLLFALERAIDSQLTRNEVDGGNQNPAPGGSTETGSPAG